MKRKYLFGLLGNLVN